MACSPVGGSEALRRLGAVTVNTDDLLANIAAAIRFEIAPAVDDDYARTQAYMAAVVLERVAREVALGPSNSAADTVDAIELHAALLPMLAEAPAAVAAAVHELGEARSIAATGPLIEALYGWGITQPAVVDALALIRHSLRRDINRRMEIAI